MLESFHLPDTLGHADFNPGNILVSPDRCVFLDWAEGSVAHPFLTFEYLRQHVARSSVREPAASERITAAYLAPWGAFYPPEILRRALAIASLIAVFAYAVNCDAWRSLETLRNPRAAGYLRSLTRRMFRESVLAAERSVPCLD